MFTYENGVLHTKKGNFSLSEIDYIDAEWRNLIVAKQKTIIVGVDGRELVIAKAITPDKVAETNNQYKKVVDEMNRDVHIINIGGQTYVNMGNINRFGKRVSTPEGDYYYLNFKGGNALFRYRIADEIREVLKGNKPNIKSNISQSEDERQ